MTAEEAFLAGFGSALGFWVALLLVGAAFRLGAKLLRK